MIYLFRAGLFAAFAALFVFGCCPLTPPTEGEGEGEGTVEGLPMLEGEGTPAVEGEGADEGLLEGEGSLEGTPEGEPEGESAFYYTYTVVNTFPHDTQAFTQGLLYDGGWLYESTGIEGRSSVRRVNIQTGEVVQIQPIGSEYFGEGLDLLNGQLYQLTWLDHLGFIYKQDTFEQIGTFRYDTQGWGLTNDGTHFIRSDGSNILSFHSFDTFEEVDTVAVTENGSPVRNLNELEMYQGQVLANVWQTNRIVRIQPATGQVTASIDLSGLLTPEEDRRADVLNGIAYDEETDRLFVTGKLWPHVFEIDLVPAS